MGSLLLCFYEMLIKKKRVLSIRRLLSHWHLVKASGIDIDVIYPTSGMMSSPCIDSVFLEKIQLTVAGCICYKCRVPSFLK